MPDDVVRNHTSIRVGQHELIAGEVERAKRVDGIDGLGPASSFDLVGDERDDDEDGQDHEPETDGAAPRPTIGGSLTLRHVV